MVSHSKSLITVDIVNGRLELNIEFEIERVCITFKWIKKKTPMRNECNRVQITCVYAMSIFKPITKKIQSGSKKLVKEIERIRFYCTGGYKKIQPRVFGRAVLTMAHPSIIETEDDNVLKDPFKPSLGSLKKHQVTNNSGTYHSTDVKLHMVDLAQKEKLTCQIVPCKEPIKDHVYDVRFQKINPVRKLARLRRQSTTPEFV